MNINQHSYKEEFCFLIRHSLYSYYRLKTEYTPEACSFRLPNYDTATEIKEKLAGFIRFDNPTLTSEDLTPINLKLPEVEIETLADLRAYIVELNKKQGNYEAARIYGGENQSTAIKNLELMIWDALAGTTAQAYTDAVLEILEELATAAELDERQTKGFYRDLVNRHSAKSGFLAILSQTVDEWVKQEYDKEKFEELQKVTACECKGRASQQIKALYSRKSFALIVAYNTMQDNSSVPLKTYQCPTKDGWHLTKVY